MAVVARSASLFGPYESCPQNPVLTNIGQSLPIKAIGHADLVDDSYGNSWAVCLGNRPLGYPFRHNLGRETMLVPIRWENGWPIMGENGAVLPEMETTASLPCDQPQGYVPGSAVHDRFTGKRMHPSWNWIYNPVPGLVTLTGSSLRLHGNGVLLSEDAPKAWIGRRQEHFCCTAEAVLLFAPQQDGEEAGLTIYMNPGHHYEIARTRLHGSGYVILCRRIGSLQVTEAMIPCEAEQITFRLVCSRDRYEFFFAMDHEKMIPVGGEETAYLTTEVGGCFTGNYIALFASGNGTDCADFAEVMAFDYIPSAEAVL